MIELETLGRLDLRGPPGRDYLAVLAQPKRLALLAYLALAHRTGYVRRDTIVALFWPDLDADHARSALRQTLRYLRRALGDDVLLTRGADEIAVNQAALVCDAVAFDLACDAGDLGTAVELYRGDLLAGLFVANAAPDLEHWIEDVRARLRHRAGLAAWKLVSRSESEGNTELAAEYARHVHALCAQDEGGLRRLMALLERLGDYDGALRAYQTFHRRLASEYDVEPAAETTALMARVRSRIGEVPAHRQGDDATIDEPAHVAAVGTPDERWALSSGSVSSGAAMGIVARHLHRTRVRTASLILAGAVGLGGVVAIVAALRPRLGDPAPAALAPTRDPVAYELYLKARFAWQQETLAGLKTAAQYLEEAVRRDSAFARAYGSLALTYAFMPGFAELAPNDAFARAQAAAQRALELDPTVADAVSALATVSAYFHWDWKEGDRLFRRAIDLAPNNASTRISYGDFLSATGHLEASIAQYERAKTLDPSSRRALNNLARRLIWAGQYDRAMTALRTALELEPNFARGHRTLGVLYVRLGRYGDAIAELVKACDLSGNRPFDLSALADAYVRSGRRAEAQRILSALEERARREYVPPTALAAIYASFGRTDDAFAWLDRAANAHDVTLALTILHESMRDPIRASPRFAALLRRMRLPT